MLRDRARTLLDPPVLDVDEGRACHARHVESMVLIKTAILYGDDGVLEIGGDAVDGDVVRTVKTRVDGASYKEHTQNPIGRVRLTDLMQLIRRLLMLRLGQQRTELLPRMRSEEERPRTDEKQYRNQYHEKTPDGKGRFFSARWLLSSAASAPRFPAARHFFNRVVHVLHLVWSLSKYMVRISSRISSRFDGSRRML